MPRSKPGPRRRNGCPKPSARSIPRGSRAGAVLSSPPTFPLTTRRTRSRANTRRPSSPPPAFGWGVPESAFVERIGYSANPHWGYRGDIYGAWGGTDDYGVYPEALVPTLNEFGYAVDVFYGGDAAAITSRIDAGMPVLTWLGYFGDTAWVQEDEGAYLLAPGMHVVTVYGYDDWGVYVSNPGRGIYDQYAWGDFLAMWSVLDGMALAVAPM